MRFGDIERKMMVGDDWRYNIPIEAMGTFSEGFIEINRASKWAEQNIDCEVEKFCRDCGRAIGYRWNDPIEHNLGHQKGCWWE